MHDRYPEPPIAYAQWTDACARAGWHGGALPGEHVPLAAALGRVSAGPVVARWPSPRADCAAMDGIAVSAGKSDPQPSRRRTLAPGTYTWVDTGDPLPPGCDTVIKREHVTIEADGRARVDDSAHVTPGHHVRARGEDFAAGQVLVPAGRRLRPADLAVAAAAGHGTLAVAREPAVAIVPTGDEIRPAGTAAGRLRPGDIIDSNSAYLAAQCARAGATATVSAIVADDPDQLAAELRRAAAGADLVLVIAGSSRGRDDHTAAVLAQVGGLTVAGLAVRPGHPGLLGYAKTPSDGAVPVIGLPGYPVAAAVVFELFAAPLLARLAGAPYQRPAGQARLRGEWAGTRDVMEWVPVHVAPDGTATPTGHGAGATSHLARANAWWVIPAGTAPVSAGAPIAVIPWD